MPPYTMAATEAASVFPLPEYLPLRVLDLEELSPNALIAVVGPPGSGASTLAAEITQAMRGRVQRVIHDVTLDDLEHLHDLHDQSTLAAGPETGIVAEGATACAGTKRMHSCHTPSASDSLFLCFADVQSQELRAAHRSGALLRLFLDHRREGIGAVVPLCHPKALRPEMRSCLDLVVVMGGMGEDNFRGPSLKTAWQSCGFGFLSFQDFVAVYQDATAANPHAAVVLDQRITKPSQKLAVYLPVAACPKRQRISATHASDKEETLR